MKRCLPVVTLIFAVTFAAMYAVSSPVQPPPRTAPHADVARTAPARDSPVLDQQSGPASSFRSPAEISVAVAAFVTFVFGMVWLAWHTIKAGPWTPLTRAREFTAAFFSTPWW